MKKSKERIMEYIPDPINTTDIVLPIELVKLANFMAKNTHDVWAKTRMEQGWTYGKCRNDELKQHPCLIPYNELPNKEKEYDIRTSIETLKLILKMGFKITKTNNYL